MNEQMIRNQALRDALELAASRLDRAGDIVNNVSAALALYGYAKEARAVAMQEPASEPNDKLRELYRRGQRIERDGEPASEPAPADESGWLIELKGPTPTWWAMLDCEDGNGFIADSTKALRFARREDAEAYIRDIGWTEAFASEHIWTAPRPASEPAPASAPIHDGIICVGNDDMGLFLLVNAELVGEIRIDQDGARGLARQLLEAIDDPAPASAHEPEIVGLRYNSDRQKYEPSEPAPASAPSCPVWEEAAQIADRFGDRHDEDEVGNAIRVRAQPCQCGELRAALEYYADKENWQPYWDQQFKKWVSRMDDGFKARSALAATAPRSGEKP